MAIRDLFLPLLNYPEPTPARAIKAVIELAEGITNRCRPGHTDENKPAVRTRISALVLETEIEPGLYFEGAHIGEFLEGEIRRSAENARLLSETFTKLMSGHNVLNACKVVKRSSYEGLKLLVQEARLHHMTVLPVAKDNDYHQEIAERLIFESGRPVLIFPESTVRAPKHSFENIAVAWDGSRPAARAVADAMPFLRRANQVRIFSAIDDKEMEGATRGIEIADQLNAEGVFAVYEEVRKNNVDDIGTFMESYVANHGSDLLVMGAYGHSRFREFILGGATNSALINPPGWVMMSH